MKHFAQELAPWLSKTDNSQHLPDGDMKYKTQESWFLYSSSTIQFYSVSVWTVLEVETTVLILRLPSWRIYFWNGNERLHSVARLQLSLSFLPTSFLQMMLSMNTPSITKTNGFPLMLFATTSGPESVTPNAVEHRGGHPRSQLCPFSHT
eukprot:scaffold425_cov175-Amphora_coffeaeformis.AAC.67